MGLLCRQATCRGIRSNDRSDLFPAFSRLNGGDSGQQGFQGRANCCPMSLRCLDVLHPSSGGLIQEKVCRAAGCVLLVRRLR